MGYLHSYITLEALLLCWWFSSKPTYLNHLGSISENKMPRVTLGILSVLILKGPGCTNFVKPLVDPWEGNGNPLHYSCLENPMDRGAWQAPWGCKEWEATEWLIFALFSLSLADSTVEVKLRITALMVTLLSNKPWCKTILKGVVRLYNLKCDQLGRCLGAY